MKNYGTNSGSSTGNTMAFWSTKFHKNVRSYRNYVIVPFDVIGSRGGNKRLWDIYSNDQRTRYNRNIRSLEEAKSLIDSGSFDLDTEDAPDVAVNS